MVTDRIVYYDYYGELVSKLQAEIGQGFSLKLHFIEYEPPKFNTLAVFEVKPENKQEIDRYLREYVYTDENLFAREKRYQYTWSAGCAIPEDKAPIFNKLIQDYLY